MTLFIINIFAYSKDIGEGKKCILEAIKMR